MSELRYRYARTIRGAPNGSLRGITVDPHDRLYAVGDSRVKVFDSSGTQLRGWTTSAPAHTAAVAPDGRVFVGESQQIEIFDEAGRLLGTWRDPRRLGRVSAIGFVNGDVLAGDSHGRAIRRFDRGGRFLNDIGNENRTQGFVIPNGVLDFSVDDGGIVHAANPGKHRVERYTPEGALLGHIGRFGGPDPRGFSGCCNPTHVCVVTLPAKVRSLPAEAGSHGAAGWLPPSGGRDEGPSDARPGASLLIYTTEKAGPRVKVHDAAGTLLSIVAADSFDPNCRNMDLAVDSRGRVYVVDTVRCEVLVFETEARA